jgi:hypothetical protein
VAHYNRALHFGCWEKMREGIGEEHVGDERKFRSTSKSEINALRDGCSERLPDRLMIGME